MTVEESRIPSGQIFILVNSLYKYLIIINKMVNTRLTNYFETNIMYIIHIIQILL